MKICANFKKERTCDRRKMAIRFALFPVVFAGSLAIFGVGFYYRYKLVIDVDEQRERRTKSVQQARDFHRKVQETIDQNKSDK